MIQGKDVTLFVHCNPNVRSMGGGRNGWLTTIQGYDVKLNPAIDDIWR
jgi:hypothetical protein